MYLEFFVFLVWCFVSGGVLGYFAGIKGWSLPVAFLSSTMLCVVNAWLAIIIIAG